MRHKPVLLIALVPLLAVIILATPAPTVNAQASSIAFTILGPNGAVARVITGDAACPSITIDGSASAMQVRAAPSEDFPVLVCDAAIPLSASRASIGGQALKLPKAKPEHVAVLGDTGCRLKGDLVQSCNDPNEWPFEPLAKSAAAMPPDLVIHVGDYHYRESPCIVDKANCAGSPFGDNWAAWNADLFTPGRALLTAAPWVMTVGNHEDCPRAGMGFFILLDPRPLPASCPIYTDPYALDYIDPQIIVLDDSIVNDFKIEPDQLAAFTTQFQQLNQMANGTTWLTLHDPMYVFGSLGVKDGKEQLFLDQLTLQQASNNTFPSSIQLFIGGHIHLFQALSFDGVRPPQLVVGNSGTLLDRAIQTPLTGLEAGGMKVAYGTFIDRFGYVTMDRRLDGSWAVGVRNVSGGEMDKCLLDGKKLECGLTVLPKVGEDFTRQDETWIAVALVGGAILFAGLAVGVRGTRRKRQRA